MMPFFWRRGAKFDDFFDKFIKKSSKLVNFFDKFVKIIILIDMASVITGHEARIHTKEGVNPENHSKSMISLRDSHGYGHSCPREHRIFLCDFRKHVQGMFSMVLRHNAMAHYIQIGGRQRKNH